MRDYLERVLRETLAAYDGVPVDFEPMLEKPNDSAHGDWSTNTALRLAGPLKRPSRAIAETLADALRARLDPERVAAVEVAGPGFLNFRFAEAHLTGRLAEILAQGEAYGRTDGGAGQRALVEYVSANPTGPLTVGHGRNAVLGDTLANLLEWTGYAVTREYYFNDAGRQMRVLGQSVRARYEALAHPGAPTKTLPAEENGAPVEVPASFPDDGYRGAYVADIARQLFDEHGEALLEADSIAPFKEAAEAALFREIEATLARLGIAMDAYFNERALYEDGRIEAVLDGLREKDLLYEETGAVWFKTSAFGKTGKDGEPADTVLVKSTGEPTYRLPDIAYHAAKLDRGFDLALDVFGADHVAAYPDVLSALEALGYESSKVDVLIYQFVTLVRGGEPVKMSTRRASYVTLDDLIDEVTPDVARFFFLMRAPGTHLDFDLDLAKENSEKNPVFYLQYAHARIHSIIAKAEETGFAFGEAPDLSLLTHPAETALLKELLRFPETLARAAEARAPHRVATYLREVAVAFSQFYDQCHILGEARPLATARMHLAEAARLVLRNGLTVLGVSAPERM